MAGLLLCGVWYKMWIIMQQEKLTKLLEDLRDGEVSVEEAVSSLRDLPFQDLGFAKIDHHRGLRCGQGEVIFCEGKSPAHVARIAEAVLSKQDVMLGTRAGEEHYEAVAEKFPEARYEKQARCIVFRKEEPELEGSVLVLTAGTSDAPVGEEARVTSEMMGAKTQLISDVGVAGLHRLLRYGEEIRRANAVVVAAGMEGALPSVVGGLCAKPVIAVPTSVGYGTNLGGFAPLLTMLNSCAAGVSVVNIDNGFGAGYMAAMINSLAVGKNCASKQNK